MMESPSHATHWARHARLGVGLAIVAIVAGLIVALGPANQTQSVYRWPPRVLPAAQPATAWYAPLILVAHTPDRLEAAIPCKLPKPLPDAGPSVVVLATARHAERVGGLSVTLSGSVIQASVGTAAIWRFEPPPDAGRGCSVRLTLAGETWLATHSDGDEERGTLDQPLTVTGLFSELDLRDGRSPSVEVTTKRHATAWTPRQQVAAVVAALTALAALILVAGGLPLSGARAAAVARRGLAGLRIEDGVVTIALLIWWVMAFTPYDDGWVKARQDAWDYLGTFSNYFDTLGTPLPTGYWLEWLQRVAVSGSDALVIGRIPTLVALLTCWLLCRAAAAMALGQSSRSQAARFTITVGFVTFAMAWGMTLRPEPFVAALTAVSLVVALRFAARPSLAPIAVAALVVAFAVTAHPGGLVALAPMIAVSPTVVRWARSAGARAWVAIGTAVTSSASVVLVLLALGSDLGLRLEDSRVFRALSGHDLGYRGELVRYVSVLDDAPTLHRLFVLLAILTVLAFLTRPRAMAPVTLDLPARSLAIGLVLLAFIPSKWIWHFGLLIAFAAVALAVETARFVDAGLARSRWSLRPFVAVAALAGAASWAWSKRGSVNQFDLRVEAAVLRPESVLTIPQFTALAMISIVVGSALVALRRHGRTAVAAAVWRSIPACVAVVLAVAMMVTVDRVAEDTALTPGWTLARQSIDGLLGRPTCGLADDSVVPDRRSFIALPDVDAAEASPSAPGAVPPPPSPADVPLFVRRHGGDDAVTPWYGTPSGRLYGFFVRGLPSFPQEDPGVPSDDDERVVVEWAEPGRFGPRVLSTDTVRPNSRGAVAASDLGTALLPWRFVARGDLTSPPAGATLVRLRIDGLDGPAGVTVSAPVSYETTLVANALDALPPQLVVPNFVVVLPCTKLPSIAHGVHEVPGVLITPTFRPFPSTQLTGTARGVLDLYTLRNLPTSDSTRRTGDIVLYEVVREIPGTALAPAVRVG